MGNKIVAINIPEEIWDELVKQNGSIKLELDDAQNLVVSEDETLKWPTAPLVWHNGRVWARSANGSYLTQGDHWHATYMDGANQKLRDGARRFAREAVPAVVVPAAEWEAFRASAARRECHRTEAELIDAADALGAGEQ